MKKGAISKLIFWAVIAFVLSVSISFIVFGQAKAQINYGSQCEKLISALQLQAQNKINTGALVEVDADNHSLVNESKSIRTTSNADFPETFDLRNCDLDGSGVNKDYVTSVKFQNPWGSCWAFAGTAASETSILSKLRQNSYTIDSEGKKHDSLDLSERHLAWFNYSPLVEGEVEGQTGEGAYSVTEADAKADGNPWWLSQRMATGGVCMSTTSSYAQGIGAVKEPNENSTFEAILDQLLYHGKNKKTMTTSKGALCYSEEDDWSIDTSLRFKQDYVLNQGIILPDAGASSKGGVYDQDKAEKVTLLMKEQLMKGRALNIAFKADNYSPKQTVKHAKYINTDTYAHYTYETAGTSHDVTVVGWDDNYPLTNFLDHITTDDGEVVSVPQPPKNGAWIVKNSWGSTDSWGQGLNINDWGYNGSGYFYLSYYDQTLKSEEAYDYIVDSNYQPCDVAHQYDYMPTEAAHGVVMDSPVYTANVYTAKNNEDIAEVGCVAGLDDVTVKCEIFKLDDNHFIDETDPVATVSNHYNYKGFYREKLNTPLNFEAGQKFAVKVTQTQGNKFVYTSAYDYNKAGYDAGLPGDHYYCIAKVNEGESYLFSDGQWQDFKGIKEALEQSSEGQYFTYDNFPIKVYAYSKLSPTPEEPEYANVSAQTNDNTNISMFILLIVGAVACLIVSRQKRSFYIN